MKRWLWVAVAGPLWMLLGCARVSVAPIEIKPIHITMDINIKIQKQLADDFAFQDEIEKASEKK